uniref:BPTI/Kunitz inhibitor domain-containing protein n=1 Tax=Globodera pallida TaxID=36090 RepID=A0A183CC25_GLOPA
MLFGQDLDFMPVPVRPMSAIDSADGDLKQEPRCLQSAETGTGTDTVPRFFYQPNNLSCVPFLYTGEGGNANNFLTELDCLNNCFIGVNEETPQEEEEDVHMIKQDPSKLGKTTGCMNGEASNCNGTESDDKHEHLTKKGD